MSFIRKTLENYPNNFISGEKDTTLNNYHKYSNQNRNV